MKEEIYSTRGQIKNEIISPWLVAQVGQNILLIHKVVGLISGQGTYKKQPITVSISRTTSWCFSLSLSNQLKTEKNGIIPTREYLCWG